MPWYFAAMSIGKDAFISRQVVFENVRRAFGGEYINSGPFWFYIPAVLKFAFPWSILAFLAGRRIRHRPVADTSQVNIKKLQGIFLSLFGFGILFFSLFSGKRHSYILPLYPALSLFLGCYILDRFGALSQYSQGRIRLWFEKVGYFGALLCILVLVGVSLIRAQFFTANPAILILQEFLLANVTRLELVAVGLGSLMVLTQFFDRKPIVRSILATFSFCILCFGVQSLAIGAKGSLKDFDRLAVNISNAVPLDETIFVSRHLREEYFDPAMYYLYAQQKRNVLALLPDTTLEGIATYIVRKEPKKGDFTPLDGYAEVARLALTSDVAKASANEVTVVYKANP